MGKYRGYEKYKDSGIEWLGDIPKHWDIWKVTHGFKNVGSGTTPKSDNSIFYDGDIPWITTAELRETVIEDTSQKITQEALENHSALKIFPTGSIAIAMYGATIGRLGILGIDATVNQACCVFSESDIFHLPFFYYWLWMHRPNLIALSVGGGQPNLSQDDLKKLRLPTPPLNEQESIAHFLDRKTSQIDTLIAKKEALLEKLDEKRTALISHAVTKGLDPNVPMKDSGVEWLGDISEHWTMTRLRFLVSKIEQGWSPSCHNYQAEDGEWGVLKAGCVNGEDLDVSENKLLPDELEPKLQYEIVDGDILMSRANTKELLGSVAIAVNPRRKLILCDKLYRLAATEIVDRQYLVRLLRSSIARLQYEKNSTGASGSMQNIGQDTVKDLILPLPSLIQQKEIAQYLENKTKVIEQQKAKVKEAITLLKEYRTALITNAVTGKIDVRQVSSL